MVWGRTDLVEEEEADNVAGLGTVKAAHGHVEVVASLLAPLLPTAAQQGLLAVHDDLPVVLADGGDGGRPVQGPHQQGLADGGVEAVDVKVDKPKSLLVL